MWPFMSSQLVHVQRKLYRGPEIQRRYPSRENMELSKGTAEVGRQRFIPKKESIFPPKRRLVKKMVLDFILNSIATHLCCPNHHPTSSSVEASSLPKTPAGNYAKNVKIFPHRGP
ncbi:hypothetical protein I3760_16G021100 [Carya illinoinensis]|nr:hypothetical protein I3760_16G021100 [Carya illinoinensis]